MQIPRALVLKDADNGRQAFVESPKCGYDRRRVLKHFGVVAEAVK
jgi:hypothetical protein